MSTADDLLQDMRDVLIGIATNRQSPTVVESAASQAAARIDAYLTRTHDRGADVLAVIERLETGLAGYNVAANPYGATIYLLSAVRDALPMLRALSAQHPAPSTALREMAVLWHMEYHRPGEIEDCDNPLCVENLQLLEARQSAPDTQGTAVRTTMSNRAGSDPGLVVGARIADDATERKERTTVTAHVHLVVAGSRQHFDQWVADNRDSHPGVRFVYVHNAHDSAGWDRATPVHLVGPAYAEAPAFEFLRAKGMIS